MALDRSQILHNQAAMQAAIAAGCIRVHAAGRDTTASLQFIGTSHTGQGAVFDLVHHVDASFAGMGRMSGPFDVVNLNVGGNDDFETYRMPWSTSVLLDSEDAEELSKARGRILSMFTPEGEGSHPDAVARLEAAFAVAREAARAAMDARATRAENG